jgi:hypothetical protein
MVGVSRRELPRFADTGAMKGETRRNFRGCGAISYTASAQVHSAGIL